MKTKPIELLDLPMIDDDAIDVTKSRVYFTSPVGRV